MFNSIQFFTYFSYFSHIIDCQIMIQVPQLSKKWIFLFFKILKNKK